MERTDQQRPSVSGGSRTPGQGSGQERTRAEGVKNPRIGPGYHCREQMQIATYYVRTLLSDDNVLVLEKELEEIRCEYFWTERS